jgi:O-antigen/teichoic acid export membrane protein
VRNKADNALTRKTNPRGAGRGKRAAFAAFAFLARSLQQISTFIITLLAARFLLPAEYGVYSLAVVFVTLIQTMTYTGFYHFIVTSKEEDADVLSTSFWMLTGLAGGASVLLMALSYPIAALFDAPDLGPVLLSLAAIQPLAGVTAWYSAVLLRRQKIQLHFVIMFLQNAMALVAGVVLVWLWQSLFALVVYRAVRVLSALFLYLVFARSGPGLRFDRALAQRALSYSAGLYGSRFMGFLSRYSGDLLMGLLFTTAEAGLYRFGNRVASGATDVVAQPMQSFALTQFGAANRQDKPMGPVLTRFVGSVIMLTGWVACIIIVFSATVVGTYFNEAYLAGIGVAYAMVARGVLNAGFLLSTPAMSAKGRTGVLMVLNTATALSVIAAVTVSAPFGLAALAWAQTAVTFGATVASLVLMRRKADIAIYGAFLALAKALVLISTYGVVLWILWGALQGATDWGVGLTLTAGLAMSVVLALPTFYIATKLRVFTLAVFSG